ncbi:MAG: glucose-6-phosphate dehydrogenase assembly protein OpcA [Chthoniobacteraceae bacterium]
MPDTTQSFSQGIPVEIGKIERELKKLWEQGDGATTRASLMNLAIYCDGADAMTKNTGLISEITQSLACRSILIATEPDAPQNHVQAWISAHCHMSRAGAKQICCEQISFLLEGQRTCELIPNIVFSHLDSDLPLYLWWQSQFSSSLDEQLWSWVDRLIFDSQTWENPREQFTLLRNSLSKTKTRLILCDLNWTRLLDWRQAVAGLFDASASLIHLQKIETASLSHAPGHHSTAMLLVGWMMAQLGWKIAKSEKSLFTFTRLDGGTLRFEIHEEGTHAVDKLRLSSDSANFQIAHESGSSFLHEEIHLPGGQDLHHMVPPGKDDIVDLFNEELMRGGKHKVYLRSLTAVESLL